MNLTLFIVTFLAIASAANADGSQNPDQVDAALATPAPTTFSDLPTPAPTNFSGLPTPAPTESADLVVTPAPTTSSSSEDGSQTADSSAGIVGVAYSSTGAVGVAYATTRAEYEAQNESSDSESSSYTVPIVVAGCLVGVLGAVAAVVVMRKRKAAEGEVETDYSNAIHTPAVLRLSNLKAQITGMAFLKDEDDVRVFEAALSFVDDYSAGASLPSETATRFPASGSLATDSTDESHRTPRPSVPSFTIACSATSGMVPLYTKCQHTAGFSLSLSPSREPLARQKSTRPKNPNRVRDEAQYELAFLREKIAELEQQLQSLQLNPPTGNSTIVSTVPRSLVQVPRVWKDMAIRQRRRRDDAQRENVRLRLIVERKRKIATGLSALLRKRLTQQGAECARVNNLYIPDRDTCVLDFQGDIEEFQDLFQHLQAAYLEVDAVFAASGLATMDIPTSDVHVREGVDGKYIEIFTNKLLPFSLRDTGEAAWDHFKGVEKHFGNGGLYEKTAKNLDQPYTIIEDFTKEMFSNNSRADVKAKQIVQRCVGPDRDMILFVSSVIPIEIKHKAIDGLVYHAREYALTKRFSESTPEHEISLLQLYVRVSFDYDPGVVYDSRHVRSVAQFVIGNVAGSLRCYQERIENDLIDQARRPQ